MHPSVTANTFLASLADSWLCSCSCCWHVWCVLLGAVRELAVQLAEQFRAFGAGMSLRVRPAGNTSPESSSHSSRDRQLQSRGRQQQPHD
jgi:hypothetical protein